jgi:hypothetical protein
MKRAGGGEVYVRMREDRFNCMQHVLLCPSVDADARQPVDRVMGTGARDRDSE